MKLTFLGATDTVTGSKYYLESGNTKILIDCGLFQGYKKLRQRNWRPLPISPKDLSAVILTHAHIDHTGYLPLLTKNGFEQPIYATPATKELCKILLPDSGYLQEEEANRANRLRYSKHQLALPLYTKEEASDCLAFFQTQGYGQAFELSPELTFTFSRAGHILGASMVKIQDDSCSILFSGDLGRPNDPIMPAPASIQNADYLVLESTYGAQKHSNVSPQEQLKVIINSTIKKGGSIIIPAFAVGRAQTILYYLYQLRIHQEIPKIPIYLDSPMASSATDIFQKFSHEHLLSKETCAHVCEIAEYIRTPEESKTLNRMNFPIIVISASGMISGGRVLHHIKNFAPNHLNTILFTGFQAAGTRGARILAGEKEVKIHGNYVPIRAKVEYLSNMSSHSDASETLAWLKNFNSPPRKVFITHGEPDAADALRIKIEENFGWECCIPDYQQTDIL